MTTQAQMAKLSVPDLEFLAAQAVLVDAMARHHGEPQQGSPLTRFAPAAARGPPATFLFVCFVMPNVFLLSSSFMPSESRR